jgi:NAD(P)-dependent dehydrogenase (short-subunit alcohol dehydrogenase family)
LRAESTGRLFADGEVAIVTGAGSGIGQAAAVRFAEEGARVVVADLAAGPAQQTVDLIAAAGGTAKVAVCDIAGDGAPDRLVEVTLKMFGRLDCAFNNAGIPAPLDATADILDDDFDRVQRVNLRAVWACMRAEIRHFLTVGGGTIVNAASVAGVVGNPLSAGYTAAKHGVVGLTRTAAGEYGTSGIRINAIAPGLTRTPMVEALMAEDPGLFAGMIERIPLGRAAESREIAEAAVWLASSRASFVHGHVLVVDGGFTAL